MFRVKYMGFTFLAHAHAHACGHAREHARPGRTLARRSSRPAAGAVAAARWGPAAAIARAARPRCPSHNGAHVCVARADGCGRLGSVRGVGEVGARGGGRPVLDAAAAAPAAAPGG